MVQRKFPFDFPVSLQEFPFPQLLAFGRLFSWTVQECPESDAKPVLARKSAVDTARSKTWSVQDVRIMLAISTGVFLIRPLLATCSPSLSWYPLICRQCFRPVHQRFTCSVRAALIGDSSHQRDGNIRQFSSRDGECQRKVLFSHRSRTICHFFGTGLERLEVPYSPVSFAGLEVLVAFSF